MVDTGPEPTYEENMRVLPWAFVIKTFLLSICEWQFYTGFIVHHYLVHVSKTFKPVSYSVQNID